MGNALERMELIEPVVTVECREPEGTFVRHVRRAVISESYLFWLYNKLKDFDTLFNDHYRGNFTRFANAFLAQDDTGPIANGLLWQVDDIGILFLTEMRALDSGLAHFVFWDRRFKGRTELCREMLRYAFEQFQFHRIRVEVPLYARPVLNFVEKIGFVKEGRAREAVLYKGEWFDVNLYSILAREVLENGS